ncbi:MAG: rod shape-determining protein MreD [Actinobacteria bacterium]|nr:rod shape-determining protein MreD [Actinomycetota bacterium]
MRKPLATAITILLALLFQAAVVPHLAIAGAQPDVVLILIVLFGFSEGSAKGASLGFVGGLVQDLLGGQVVGLSAFSKAIVGYVSGFVERTIFVENVLLPMGAILTASVLNDFTYAGFNFLLGEKIGLSKLFFDMALPTALYNALAMPLVYLVYRRLTTPRPEKTPMTLKRKWG